MSARGRMVTEVAALEALAVPWDALAVDAGRPLAAPGWLLAWWRAMAPHGARLRAVVVEDERGLVGVAPFFATRARGLWEYRPVGAGMAIRAAPLAGLGREREVAREVARTLASAAPRPGAVHLDQLDAASPWPGMIARNWPGRLPARLERLRQAPAPVMHLTAPGYAEWMAAKSGNFRQRARRDRRRRDERGVTAHLAATPEEVDRAVADFHRLHALRWGDESPLVTAAGLRMVTEAGRGLPAGRLRAYTLAADGAPIAVQIFVGAGGEVVYWNGGWDPEWAALSPALAGILVGVEDAFGRGERRVDLGEDDHHYKRRLADADAPIAWFRILPRDRGYPRTLAVTLPERARALAGHATRRLPEERRARLRRVRERGRRRLRGLGRSG